MISTWLCQNLYCTFLVSDLCIFRQSISNYQSISHKWEPHIFAQKQEKSSLKRTWLVPQGLSIMELRLSSLLVRALLLAEIWTFLPQLLLQCSWLVKRIFNSSVSLKEHPNSRRSFAVASTHVSGVAANFNVVVSLSVSTLSENAQSLSLKSQFWFDNCRSSCESFPRVKWWWRSKSINARRRRFLEKNIPSPLLNPFSNSEVW